MSTENKWKNTSSDGDIMVEKTLKSNTSKKMGIAMGVIGAVLVVAGAAPLFMSSDNLSGDITTDPIATEAPDPLVALLMGGSDKTPNATPAVSTSGKATPSAIANLSAVPDMEDETGGIFNSSASEASTKEASDKTVSSTPKVSPTSALKNAATSPKATPTSELEKILAEEGSVKVTNNNIGKTDKEGTEFGEVTVTVTDTDTSTETIHASGGQPSTSSSSVKQPTPKQNVQTGIDPFFLLSALFFLGGSAVLLGRRDA